MKRKMYLALLVTCAMIFCLSGCGKSKDKDEKKEEASIEVESDEAEEVDEEEASNDISTSGTYKDRTLTTKDCIIKITDYKVVKPGEEGNNYDNPEIVFWYDITNLSDENMDTTQWNLLVSAYQDNDPNYENSLEIGFYTDDDLFDLQMENIKKGGTIKGYSSYELTDDVTPVTLKFRDDVINDDFAEDVFEIK